MKTFWRIGFYGLSVGLLALFAGCSTEKIYVDYVMPARAVNEINKVNVAAIRVSANVTGNLAGDNGRNAGLIKQLLAMRLYKEGYYQVADDLWADPKAAQDLCEIVKKNDSGHGYSGFVAKGQNKSKVIIDLALDLELDAKPTKKEMAFTLETVPYKVINGKEGEAPTSVPDAKATVIEKVKTVVSVYEVVAKGTLKAKFCSVDGVACPQLYENTFSITMPASDRFDSARPSQLKTLAAAVTPAIDGVVADISPHRETHELVASEGGDERVVYLLNAKAFAEVVTVVEDMEAAGKAECADYENLGIAFEAMGDFFSAKEAYAKAVKAESDSAVAQAGVKRMDEVLAGKRAVKESRAEQNKDTKFSKK